MSEYRKRGRRVTLPPGAAPGTLAIDPEAPAPVLSVLAYGPEGCHEAAAVEPDALADWRDRAPVLWVQVVGLGDAAALRRVGEVFGVHLLALEDVVHVHQRAKVESFGDHTFVVARTLREDDAIDTRQLSIYFGPGFVLSFIEAEGDDFEPVRARIRTGNGRIRRSGPDYLAYALLDAVVDHYFPVLARLGERWSGTEEAILEDPRPEHLAHVHQAKRDLLTLRRSVWPLREALRTLWREPPEGIAPDTVPFFRDCDDHALRVIDLVETHREVASSLLDVYMSTVSYRMNEVMKVLTIIATVFIPLSFVTGLYGMNFDPDASPWSMPELGWYWGYPAVLVTMASAVVAMLVYFRRRGWIGGASRRDEGGRGGGRP